MSSNLRTVYFCDRVVLVSTHRIPEDDWVWGEIAGKKGKPEMNRFWGPQLTSAPWGKVKA